MGSFSDTLDLMNMASEDLLKEAIDTDKLVRELEELNAKRNPVYSKNDHSMNAYINDAKERAAHIRQELKKRMKVV